MTDRALAPLVRRVNMMLSRGVLRATDDGAGIQKVQASLLHDELGDLIERFQTYGLSSHVPPGADVVAAFIAGNRDQGIIVGDCARGARPRGLKQGEVCLYNDHGVSLLLDAGGNLTIKAASLTITATGNVTIATPGDVSISGRNVRLVASGSLSFNKNPVVVP